MKLKSPHFDKLKSLTKKQKKLILAGIALLLLILAACYTVLYPQPPMSSSCLPDEY